MVKITDTDKNFKTSKLLLSKMNGVNIRAGYFGSNQSRPNDKADNILLAVVHNLGSVTRNIPARPTMAPAFDKNNKEYTDILSKIVDSTLVSKSIDLFKRNITKLGIKMRDDINTEITNLTSPALQSATISRKKSSKPLIDKGKMRQATTSAITYE